MTYKQDTVANYILTGALFVTTGISCFLLTRVVDKLDSVADKVDSLVPEVREIKSQTDRNTQDIRDFLKVKFEATKKDHTYEGKEGIF